MHVIGQILKLVPTYSEDLVSLLDIGDEQELRMTIARPSNADESVAPFRCATAVLSLASCSVALRSSHPSVTFAAMTRRRNNNCYIYMAQFHFENKVFHVERKRKMSNKKSRTSTNI